jgi:hypothetical protein
MKQLFQIAALFVLAFALMGQTTFPQTYYISVNSARARSCAETSCRIVTSFRRGTAITVNGTVQGSTVQGNRVWLEVDYNDSLVYVHSSLATTRAPASSQTNVQSGGQQPSPTQGSQSSQQLVSTPVPPPVTQPTWNCSVDYDCGDFPTCNDMRSYMSACPGDPAGLDRDNDGHACESQCGG